MNKKNFEFGMLQLKALVWALVAWGAIYFLAGAIFGLAFLIVFFIFGAPAVAGYLAGRSGSIMPVVVVSIATSFFIILYSGLVVLRWDAYIDYLRRTDYWTLVLALINCVTVLIAGFFAYHYARPRATAKPAAAI